jgi:hypothetical protein
MQISELWNLVVMASSITSIDAGMSNAESCPNEKDLPPLLCC